MPYADREEQLAAMRRSYADRYASDPKFRRAESKRKARYYSENLAYQRRVKKKVKARRKSV
jgi:hypothetical protein